MIFYERELYELCGGKKTVIPCLPGNGKRRIIARLAGVIRRFCMSRQQSVTGLPAGTYDRSSVCRFYIGTRVNPQRYSWLAGIRY